MANSTVTLAASISFLDPDSGVTPAVTLALAALGFDGSEHVYMKGLMTVPTPPGGVVIPLGPVTSPGDMLCINQDAVNFITIYDNVNASPSTGNPMAQLDAKKV